MKIQAYGFGSYFNDQRSSPNDIDLLLVHTDRSEESINFVIYCKKRLLIVVQYAHITMLSDQEEQSQNFLEKSKSILIGEIQHHSIEQDLLQVERQIFKLQRNPGLGLAM